MRKLFWIVLMSVAVFVVACAAQTGQPSKESNHPPQQAKRDGDLTIATWNLEWFYDWYIDDNQSETAKVNSAPSKKDWEWRLDASADAIAKMHPTFLALQEIENRKVLDELVERIKARHRIEYEVCFVQGRDVATEQDVAVLCLKGLRPQFRRAPEPREFDRRDAKRVSKQLMVEVPWGEGQYLRRISIITVHLMSGADIGKEMDRCDQARYIKRWIKDEHRLGHYVVLVGDMNTVTMQPSRDLKESALDVLTGKDTPNDQDDDLEDVIQLLPPEDRVTFGSRRNTLDHILISPKLRTGPGVVFDGIANRKDLTIRGRMPDFQWRGDRRFWKVPEEERDLSDHYPIMARFRKK